jgi:hypothetical protein
MSALGQKQTSDQRPSMSVLPPKADMAERYEDVLPWQQELVVRRRSEVTVKLKPWLSITYQGGRHGRTAQYASGSRRGNCSWGTELKRPVQAVLL